MILTTGMRTRLAANHVATMELEGQPVWKLGQQFVRQQIALKRKDKIPLSKFDTPRPEVVFFEENERARERLQKAKALLKYLKLRQRKQMGTQVGGQKYIKMKDPAPSERRSLHRRMVVKAPRIYFSYLHHRVKGYSRRQGVIFRL